MSVSAALKEVPQFQVQPEGTVNLLQLSEDGNTTGNGKTGASAGDMASAQISPSKKDSIEDTSEPTHINMFIWLRLMLHRFQQEQSHRAAAVRLMFDTASVGALSNAPPPSGSGLSGDTPTQSENNGHVEYPQFNVRNNTHTHAHTHRLI